MSLTLDELGLPSDVLLWQALLLTAVSFAVGLLGGFVGLALGTMRLPALLLLGIPAPVAGGTNILVSGLSSLAGAARHLRAGRVNWRMVLVMGVPAFAGAFIGGLASDRISETLLIFLAGLLVFWQGVEFLDRAYRGQGRSSGDGREGDPPGIFTRRRVALTALIGLGVGLLGGAVGLILGSIRLPSLIRVLRADPRIAAETNLTIGVVMGALGWIGHAFQGQVDYPLLVLMGAAGMAGSDYGASFTGRVKLNTLIMTMGWVMLGVGILLLVQAFRS